MITLNAADTLQGKAGTASVITYTLMGDAVSAGADSFKVLAQGQLAAATAVVYTVPGSTQALVKQIQLANTSGVDVAGVTFYVNGTAATNQITGTIAIPANGTAVYANGVWQVYSSTGALLTGATLLTSDKNKLDNLWIDVTANTIALVAAANTGAQNITAVNAIMAAAPNGSTLYFPPGLYLFNAAWTMPNKMFTFMGRGSNRAGSPATAFTELRWNTNVGATLIVLPGSGNGWYTTFWNLTFTTTVDQTAGAVIDANGNVGINIHECAFQSSGGFFLDVLKYDGGAGSNSANSTVVDSSNIQGFKGTAVRVNAAGSSLVITNTVINGQWGTTAQAGAAGISGGWVGALQIIGCDVIGCVNNLLLNPITANSEVAASIFCTNTYFDSSFGSCIKISGTGATVRCRFDTCSFTTNSGGTAFSAVEIASTFAYTANGQGLDFVNCNAMNTFGTTGTTNGFLISGTADFSIVNCRIAGWTNGVQITPMATAGRTRASLSGNTIGPCGGIGANSTGVVLNAGAAVYGSIILADNDLSGNTVAAYSDASTITANTGQKIMGPNAGAMLAGGYGTVTAATTFTTEVVLAPLTTPLPIGSLQVGTTFRFKVQATAGASSVYTMRIHLGVNGTTADATVLTVAMTAGVTNPGGAVLEGVVAIRTLGSSGVTVATGWGIATGAAAATPVITIPAAAPTATTINTTIANVLTCSVQSSVGTGTVGFATAEVLKP